MLGHRIWGKRLGIVGMGRIGQAVARRAKAFGLQIHYHNRQPRRRPRSRRSSRRPIGRASTRCWPAWTSSRSTARIRRPPITCCRRGGWSCCSRTPIIVNTARGEVIDEEALASMLEDGEIAGAGLDVFEHEPAVNPKLLKLATTAVVLLPHMGSATLEGRIDMGEKVIINIKTFMDGHSAARPGPSRDVLDAAFRASHMFGAEAEADQPRRKAA